MRQRQTSDSRARDEGAQDPAEFWTPVDGTMKLILGLPLFAISPALVHQQTAVIGVIILPHLRRRYCAGGRLGRMA